MQPTRRKCLKAVSSIGVAGTALAGTSTVAAADYTRTFSVYNQDQENSTYYSARLHAGSADEYKKVEGTLQPDGEAHHQFEGTVLTFYADNEVLVNADQLDTDWCKEQQYSCGGSKEIWCDGQGCYQYYDATTSGSDCLYDESTSVYIDDYLWLLQFDIDSQGGSMYYY